jgi:hypothetical protein
MVIGGLALAAVVLSSVAWAMRDEYAYATLAAGFAAKQTCSCVHVSGRSLESCVSEFPDEVRNNITISQEDDVVRASVLFGAISSEAVFEEDYGCRFAD